jgi:hypothetical protein
MAESEPSVASSQCLAWRIADKQTLIEEVVRMGGAPQQQTFESRLAVHHR